MYKPRKDLTGKKFDKITVLGFSHKKLRVVFKGKGVYDYFWFCKCDCGKEFTRERKYIVNKDATHKSCGCWLVNKQKKKLTTHGMTNTRAFRIWATMKARVTNPSHKSYSAYGGSGIKVCDRWMNSFIDFYNDMGEEYERHVKEFGEKETTLERLDYKGDYNKENCTWATLSEQQGNRRNNKRFIATSIETGEKIVRKNVRAFAREIGINSSRIYYALNESKTKVTGGYKFEYTE